MLEPFIPEHCDGTHWVQVDDVYAPITRGIQVKLEFVMKFLINEGVKPIGLNKRHPAWYSDETHHFKEGCTSVIELRWAGSTALIPVNIQSGTPDP